jgi:outer membrane murein-binding lipoprotein Lpp
MSLTPEQFNKLATRDGLGRVEDKVDSLTSNVSQLLTAVDGLAKNVKDIEHAFVSNQAAHDRFEERLTRIEKHLDLNPMFNLRN